MAKTRTKVRVGIYLEIDLDHPFPMKRQKKEDWNALFSALRSSMHAMEVVYRPGMEGSDLVRGAKKKAQEYLPIINMCSYEGSMLSNVIEIERGT